MSRKSNPSKSKKRRNGSSTLPGWPGYRTREGRSGYDPVDSRAEAGHMAGSMIQKLFTGRITNRIHLALLGILGLILIAPLILAISEAWNGSQLSWNAWLFLLIIGIAGLAILINFIKNLLGILR